MPKNNNGTDNRPGHQYHPGLATAASRNRALSSIEEEELSFSSSVSSMIPKSTLATTTTEPLSMQLSKLRLRRGGSSGGVDGRTGPASYDVGKDRITTIGPMSSGESADIDDKNVHGGSIYPNTTSTATTTNPATSTTARNSTIAASKQRGFIFSRSAQSPKQSPSRSPSRSWMRWRPTISAGTAPAPASAPSTPTRLSPASENRHEDENARDNSNSTCPTAPTLPSLMKSNSDRVVDPDNLDSSSFWPLSSSQSTSPSSPSPLSCKELEEECEKLESSVNHMKHELELSRMKTSISLSTYRSMISHTKLANSKLQEQCTALESKLDKVHGQNRTVQKQIMTIEHQINDRAEI